MSALKKSLPWICLACLGVLLFLDLGPAKPFAFAGLMVILTAYGIQRASAIIGRQLNGETVLRLQRGLIPWWVILLSVLNTFSYFNNKGKEPYEVLIWWWILAFSIVNAVRLTRSKPAMFATQRTELLINGSTVSNRDLRKLTHLQYNGVFGFFRLRFEGASAVTLERRHYNEAELDGFLQHVLQLAGPQVVLTENLRYLTAAQPVPAP
jgi:hypothetical protein